MISRTGKKEKNMTNTSSDCLKSRLLSIYEVMMCKIEALAGGVVPYGKDPQSTITTKERSPTTTCKARF